MPDYFLCGNYDCFYCRIDGICNRGEFAFDEAIKTNDDIAVLIDTFVEPPCFDSFKNHDDYTSAYWMMCKDNEGIYRRKSHGKRLKVNGFTLYTESRIYQGNDNDDLALLDVRVTEEMTGLAETLYDFHNEERIERIKQIVQTAQKVLSVERIKEAKDQ